MNDRTRRSLEDYLHDLETVRDLLTRHEEKSMIESWAFYIWGVLVILGTVVHALLSQRSTLDETAVLLSVWGPVVLLGGGGEMAAWLARVRSEKTPLFGRRFVRFVLSAVGAFIAVVPVVLVLYRNGLLSPGLALLLVSFVFLIYAEITFSSLFFEAYILLFLGLGFFVLGVTSITGYLVAGMAVGLAFLAFGVHAAVLEKERS